MSATQDSSNSRGAAFRASFRARIEAPVAAIFIRTHLTPNMLTLIGFGIAVLGAYLVAIHAWILAGLVVGFGAAFDLFDGALARATGKSSKFGAFMDSTFDRAGEAVVYVGLVVAMIRLSDANGAALAAAAMAAAFMVSYSRAKSESLGFSSGKGIANVGLAPREVRSVILVIGLIGAAIDVRVLIAAVALIAILATVTTIQRILFVYEQSKQRTN
ncbi:MAG TPA: CDP-alcohol phosphatidyltransferase family protein [Candidatus Limnocylindrales bacterium]|jgi:CDP-diacylglycerol--glycerol-3-phosphate 3-phosphatidyltransferase